MTSAKMGGGSNRFELVAVEYINEPIYRKPISIDGYDEVYVICENLTGEGNLIIQLGLATTTTTKLVDFLTNSAKQCRSVFSRLSPTEYKVTYSASGGINQTVLTRLITPEGITYEDKIDKISISTGDKSKLISSAKITIYGRNQTNESI